MFQLSSDFQEMFNAFFYVYPTTITGQLVCLFFGQKCSKMDHLLSGYGWIKIKERLVVM